MQSTNKKSLLAALLAAYLASTPVLAKVSPEEAARLGKDLTPMGAEMAGNADGSIPAWSGKWRGAPPHVKFAGPGSPYADPYADEQPLFTITAENMAQYRDRLSTGQQALLQRYPRSFQMLIYPSHRDFRYSQRAEDNVMRNALDAELVNGGDGVTGAYGGAPFPIPRNGHQLLWNHNLRATAWKEDAEYRMALTTANGSRQLEVTQYQIRSPWNDPAGRADTAADIYAWGMHQTLAPSRKRGEIILVHAFINPAVQPTQTWQYLPGTRRVRRAPTIGYDHPYGAGGYRTIDEDRLFNGSPDRYDWTLVGKRELYIPYDNYRLNDPGLALDALLTEQGHLNPEHVRYELHRVWVLEANLKPGQRHVYSRRVLYLDEDSWAAVLADNYDGRGNLWRTNLQSTIYAYDLQGFHAGAAVYHDLTAGSYLADRLINDQSQPRLNDSGALDASYFTPANLRKLGL